MQMKKLTPRARRYMGSTKENKGFRHYMAKSVMGNYRKGLFIKAMKEKRSIEVEAFGKYNPTPLIQFYP